MELKSAKLNLKDNSFAKAKHPAKSRWGLATIKPTFIFKSFRRTP